MLGNPGGAALACIGLIDRAWDTCFPWSDVEKTQLEIIVGHVASGRKVGGALQAVADEYARLTVELDAEVAAAVHGARPDAVSLARLSARAETARSWILLGDPAVSLR